MAEVMEMPKLSDTMEEGVIVAWHKKVGDKVESGELLAEVETDKATMELESFYDGTLLHVGVEEGNSVPIGKLLVVIGEEGEDISQILKESNSDAKPETDKTEDKPREQQENTASAEAETTTADENASNGRLKASPLAKAMAKENNLDLERISGTGDGGRIIKRDIEAALASPQSKATTKVSAQAPATGQEGYRDERVSQMRKTIAKRLSESKYSAPHFYLTMEVDMALTVEARKRINEVSPVKISFNDIIIKAAAAALKQHPQVNASWIEGHIRYYNHIHIGMAVAVPEGLVVPVIRFVDMQSLSSIAESSKALAQKARDKKLQPEEMQGSTFTISNLGMFGIEAFTAIINPPDACILAVGGIVDKPVVKNGEIVPGKTMKITLSCDHRVVDGATGAEFLRTLKGLLEDPVRILI